MNKINKDIIINRQHKLEKFIRRIDGLEDDEYFIEVFLLQFSMIEDILIKIIKEYGKILEDVLVKKKIKFNFKEIHKDRLNKEPFGKLIHYLKIFNQDSPLIEKLELLNTLRIKCVHGIFSSDIDELNQEVKSQLYGQQKLIGHLLDILALDLLVYPNSLENIPKTKLN